MGKKVNTGFGPTSLKTSGPSTANQLRPWIKFGPIIGNDVSGRAVFSPSTPGDKVFPQGILAGTTFPSSAIVSSGVGVVDILNFNSSQSSAKISTEAGMFTYVRLGSTALTSGRTATVHFGAIT
jgi:hypothetical protein